MKVIQFQNEAEKRMNGSYIECISVVNMRESDRLTIENYLPVDYSLQTKH